MALSENRKIHGFWAAFDDDDDQSASSYRLPVGGASLISLRISTTSFRPLPLACGPRRCFKLLPYPGVCSCRFCCFEGKELVKARSFNRHVTELTGMKSFENLNKTDVNLSSSEAEDLEAAVRSIIEATSWMDWWTFTMKSMAFKSSHETHLINLLCLAGARCQLLVAKTASTSVLALS